MSFKSDYRTAHKHTRHFGNKPFTDNQKLCDKIVSCTCFICGTMIGLFIVNVIMHIVADKLIGA